MMPPAVPCERIAQPFLHADVEIHHHENRRLQPVGEIEGQRRKFESLLRVLRKDKDVLGVPVRRIGTGEQVCLLRASRHPGRRTAALHVEDHRWNLREVSQADELLHE